MLPFFLFISSASAQMAEELQLTYDREGRVLATVKVDKYGDYPFLLDTAASSTLLSQALQQSLKLIPHSEQRSSVTANGSYKSSIYYVGTLWLGKIRLPMGYVGTIANPGNNQQLAQYNGIVGGNVWRTSIVEFNLDDSKVRFFHHGTDFTDGDWQSLVIERLRSGLFMVKLEIEGEEVNALFDTGANASVVNRPAARAVGLAYDGRLMGGERVYDSSSKSVKASSFIAENISLAGTTISGHKLIAADLSVFRALNISGQPAMILGMDILSKFNFIIDLPGGRVLMRAREG